MRTPRGGATARRRTLGGLAAVGALASSITLLPDARGDAGAQPVADLIEQVTSTVHVAGELFTATNHLVDGADQAGEYLVVWAGDENVVDTTGADVSETLDRLAVDPVRVLGQTVPDALPGQDFLAIIDADPASTNYGEVVNTVTLGPLVENEPHHMQYLWHAGDRIYAGSLFLDTTYVLDVSQLPLVSLSGVNLPTDTPCGSVPDAYWVLEDGTAYGTYMGGPDVPGPCVYSNGETRIGNGFAGSPGSLVHIGPEGQTLSEVPADVEGPVDRDPVRCPGVPTIVPTCANPHGIQVREDLDVLVTSDYAEPKNVILDPLRPLDPHLFRDTVRIWDISDRDNARVVSVTAMPDGPRVERNPGHEEPRGIMEVTVTNQPEHRGAFASSMCGGVVYYAPDITSPTPAWREVFDITNASRSLQSTLSEGAGCSGAGWVQTSLDDRFLFHAVIGRNPGALDTYDQGVPKMVYVLDIQALLAAGDDPACNIDTIHEVYDGGAEPDCPALVDAIELRDGTSGGPHWGALDNFARNEDGTWSETTDVGRIAVSNYFVSRSNTDGNHRVCIVDVSDEGALTLDEDFRDEHHGTPCVDFNRTVWPHGSTGNAKPHSQLFVVPERHLVPGELEG